MHVSYCSIKKNVILEVKGQKGGKHWELLVCSLGLISGPRSKIRTCLVDFCCKGENNQETWEAIPQDEDLLLSVKVCRAKPHSRMGWR